jgi:hypothetical protein
MERLPLEIALKILDFLSTNELCLAAQVNSYWNMAVSSRLYKHPTIKTEKQLCAFTRISKSSQMYIQALDSTYIHEHLFDKHFRSLPYLHNLNYINLSKCTYLSPPAILPLIKSNVYNLHTLILANCTLSNDILVWIGEASQHRLKYLDLSNTMIKPCVAIDTFNHLDSMFDSTNTAAAQLRHLNLSYCTWVNGQTVRNIALGLPKLEELVLQWCNQINLKSIDFMVQQLMFLNTIDIRHIETIGNSKQAIQILEHAVSLKKVLFTYRTISSEVALV